MFPLAMSTQCSATSVGDEDDGSEQCRPLGGLVHHWLCPAVHLCHCTDGHFEVWQSITSQRSLHYLAVPYHLCCGHNHVLVRCPNSTELSIIPHSLNLPQTDFWNESK